MIVISLKDPNKFEQRFELDKSIVLVGASPDCDVPLSLVQSDKPALYIRKSRENLLLHPCVPGISTRSGLALSLNADEKILPDEVYLLPGNYSLQASFQNQEMMMEANAGIVVGKAGIGSQPKIIRSGIESGSNLGRLVAFMFLGIAILSLAIGSFISSSVDITESGNKTRNRKEIFEMFAGKLDDLGMALIRQAELHAAMGSVDKAIDLFQQFLSMVGNSSSTGDRHVLESLRSFSQGRLSDLLKSKRQTK